MEREDTVGSVRARFEVIDDALKSDLIVTCTEDYALP